MIDITAPGARGRGRPGIRCHRATTIEADDYDELRTVPVTSLPRTLIDLGSVVHVEALEYAIHRAEWRRHLDLDELRARVARMPANHRGAARVRTIIGRGGHELDAQTRSPWEVRFLAICRDYELPTPEVSRWIPLPIAAGGLEVDFCWPVRRLVVEVDDDASHSTARARKNDPARDRALRAAGWRTVRIAEAEFAWPRRIAEKVSRALGDRFARVQAA